MIFLKRFMDIFISIVALIIFFPIMLIIAILIKIDSRGSIFFKQGRLSRSGKIFNMYKFRTMIENAEHMGTGLFNYENDFRVTRIGKILRKTSLDELPQLLNVLIGDMSIVGPRPPVSYELGLYDELNDEYKNRFTMLPGITGLAQVKGRNELSWDEKVKYDNEYISLFEKYGVMIDIRIIIKTVINVFSSKNIYEIKNNELENVSDDELSKKAAEKVVANAKK